jgi:hypothetical protein
MTMPNGVEIEAEERRTQFKEKARTTAETKTSSGEKVDIESADKAVGTRDTL